MATENQHFIPAEITVERNFHAIFRCRLNGITKWSFTKGDWPHNVHVFGSDNQVVFISSAQLLNAGGYTCHGTAPDSDQEASGTLEANIMGEYRTFTTSW